jgi:hypothetical protein
LPDQGHGGEAPAEQFGGVGGGWDLMLVLIHNDISIFDVFQ